MRNVIVGDDDAAHEGRRQRRVGDGRGVEGRLLALDEDAHARGRRHPASTRSSRRRAPTTAAAPVTYIPESPPPSTPLYESVWLWAGIGAVVPVTTTVILFVAFNTERTPDKGTLGPGITVVTRSPLVTF